MCPACCHLLQESRVLDEIDKEKALFMFFSGHSNFLMLLHCNVSSTHNMLFFCHQRVCVCVFNVFCDTGCGAWLLASLNFFQLCFTLPIHRSPHLLQQLNWTTRDTTIQHSFTHMGVIQRQQTAPLGSMEKPDSIAMSTWLLATPQLCQQQDEIQGPSNLSLQVYSIW